MLQNHSLFNNQLFLFIHNLDGTQKLQDMEEKRIERLGVCMKTFAEVDRQVLPIVGKCLDGMTSAAEGIEPKTVSTHSNKSVPRPHMGHITHYVLLITAHT